MHAPDELTRLPPAALFTNGFDPLGDVGIEYGHKLQDAGVQVAWKHYPAITHGLVQMAPWSEMARGRRGMLGREGVEEVGVLRIMGAEGGRRSVCTYIHMFFFHIKCNVYSARSGWIYMLMLLFVLFVLSTCLSHSSCAVLDDEYPLFNESPPAYNLPAFLTPFQRTSYAIDQNSWTMSAMVLVLLHSACRTAGIVDQSP